MTLPDPSMTGNLVPERAQPERPLWIPPPERVAASNLAQFQARLAQRRGLRLRSWDEVYAWSVAEPEAFWTEIWDYGGVIAETRGSVALTHGERMPGARFFPDARLNFAENLLRRRDEATALRFWGEDQVRRTLTWKELHAEVSRFARALLAEGVQPGDRVAGYLPNLPEAVVAFLATASIGAVWSSASPDFGTQSVLDRFGQIEPTILVAADGYFYGGKSFDTLERLPSLLAGLPSVRRVVVVSYIANPDVLAAHLEGIPGAVALSSWLSPHDSTPVEMQRFPFNHPLVILYSSGTTGKPKCIVHGAGGTLLQHLKEHRLHCNIRPGDRVFYYTTLGWMMWNWLVSALASEATLLLYDGSPFYPSGNVLFDMADAEGMTLFGTSAKYIDSLHKNGYHPVQTHRLETLRTLTSTGSPLSAEAFAFAYKFIKRDLHLASISGGSDIVSCFVLGTPTLPVWAGEIQGPGLGMAVTVFTEAGQPAAPGEQGELVCTRPFPSMPLGFWNDPDGSRYRNAYFARFPEVWCHGDYAALTEHGGIIIFGRSDATLNPGGVRIGTAELYRQVEPFEEVVEALAVGQDWDGDVRIVLFVRLRDGLTLSDDLVRRIRTRIRTQTSPRHVPAKIVQVSDIPRTRSGKITELAVREAIHGRAVTNLGALANPEALENFFGRPELQD